MLTVPELKILGLALSLAGTTILGFRVTKVIKQLIEATEAFDDNFRELGERNGRPKIITVGNGTNVVLAHKAGVKLVALGFFFQFCGVACNALAMWLDQ